MPSRRVFLAGVVALTPAMFGAGAASDDTQPLQRMLDAAAGEGRPCDFGGRPYRVSTLRIPSGTRARGMNLVSLGGSDDGAPITFDGTAAPVRDCQLRDVRVHGSRGAHANLRSSGGDGQRFGIAVLGRCADISVVQARVEHCATDGIILFNGGVRSRADDDYLQENITFLNVDVSWCGRHGVSCMSVRNLRLTGRSKHNGKDAGGGPANGGAVARRYRGRRYGRPFTWEGSGLGQGFDRMDLRLSDATENASGLLFYEGLITPETPGFVPRRGLRLQVGLADAPDHADWGFPLNVTQSTEYHGHNPTFVDVAVSGRFVDAPASFVGVRGLRLQGLQARGVVLTNCSQVQR
jgi:hypothetical protein